ncbi:MAG: flagellar motor switch protein FliG [Myxococcota bacterium]|nr:flagellar motor switch protein FliG [Myxococcota bacterium]
MADATTTEESNPNAQMATVPEPEPELEGRIKAALWLLSIDEDLAVEIMGHLSDLEIASISKAVREIGRTTPAQLAKIHREFSQILASDPMHLKGSMEYLRKVTSRAFGDERAREILGLRAPPLPEGEGLDVADLDVLSGMLKQEHPQITAAILASVAPARSAEILKRLPESVKRDAVWRVAKLTSVPRYVLDEAERILSAGMPTGQDSHREVDGIRTAAQLLNQMDSVTVDDILTSLESDTNTIAEDIRRAMFTFEDLVGLDKRGFGVLLKEVQSDQLLVALKTASVELRELVFSSLSQRAAEMLKDDLEVMRPVRLSDVQEAQQAIIATALQLKGEGKLMIGGGDDYV